MKERAGWVVGGTVAVVVIVGVLIALGRAGERVSAERARRFGVACQAAGFAPAQCAFLAELDRRTSDAADGAAIAGLNAANASLQATMPR